MNITPLKPSKSQIVRPSGIIQSKDGKYFFWICNHCGAKTFANAKRFEKLVKQYGSEEALFKTFICKAAKNAVGVESPKVEKPVKMKKASGKKVVDADGVEAPKAPTQPKEQEKPVYPWQKEANYFGSGKLEAGPINFEEATKDSCFFPPHFMDDECKGCPIYDRCNLPTKFTAEQWARKEKKFVPKVKTMVFVEEPKQ
jgi:Zn-finger protein